MMQAMEASGFAQLSRGRPTWKGAKGKPKRKGRDKCVHFVAIFVFSGDCLRFGDLFE